VVLAAGQRNVLHEGMKVSVCHCSVSSVFERICRKERSHGSRGYHRLSSTGAAQPQEALEDARKNLRRPLSAARQRNLLPVCHCSVSGVFQRICRKERSHGSQSRGTPAIRG
jgi:hypothetical protein